MLSFSLDRAEVAGRSVGRSAVVVLVMPELLEAVHGIEKIGSGSDRTVRAIGALFREKTIA